MSITSLAGVVSSEPSTSSSTSSSGFNNFCIIRWDSHSMTYLNSSSQFNSNSSMFSFLFRVNWLINYEFEVRALSTWASKLLNPIITAVMLSRVFSFTHSWSTISMAEPQRWWTVLGTRMSSGCKLASHVLLQISVLLSFSKTPSHPITMKS